MQYSSLLGEHISSLGFGAMRLPLLDENNSNINEEDVYKMVDAAFDAGVNYFDTAYGYHNGKSEVVLGKALARHPRDSYYLADKFPGYDTSNFGKVEDIFAEQLKRCGVDYFDFYLFHNVCESNIEYYLDKSYGTYDFLVRMKEEGRIQHLGFSAHGELDTIKRFLDAYGEKMEFCQLQINWIDWEFQHAKEKAQLLDQWSIPLIIMEPLRGGKLLSLTKPYKEQLAAANITEDPLEAAFKFCRSLPNVITTLSGMSSLEQVKENTSIWSSPDVYSEEELKALYTIANEMTTRSSVPCTACSYCTSYCPQKINIPKVLDLYNEHVFTQGGFIAPMMINQMPEGSRPKDCISCRSCEAVCPQGIKISECMNDFVTRLANNPWK